MFAGQLELDPEEGPSILERMTLTYSIGKEHALTQLIEERGLSVEL